MNKQQRIADALERTANALEIMVTSKIYPIVFEENWSRPDQIRYVDCEGRVFMVELKQNK